MYTFNVSKNGRHVFATTKRSAQTMEEAIRLGKLLREKFHVEDGYAINFYQHNESKTFLSLSEAIATQAHKEGCTR